MIKKRRKWRRLKLSGRRYDKNSKIKIKLNYKTLIFILLIALAYVVTQNTSKMFAYFSAQKSVINGFSIETYTITYEYYKYDENNNSSVLQETTTRQAFPNEAVELVGSNELVNDNSYLVEFDIDGTVYANNSIYTMPDHDVTIKQNYYKKVYNVIFNSNGGSGNMDNQKFVYGTSQALSTNLFTREDYVFTGWNTQANGQGDLYLNEQEVNNLTETHNGVVTLYAQWREGSEISIKYHYGNSIDFDGTSYINTGVGLFTEANQNMDFEITADVDDYVVLANQNMNYNTIFSNMDERGAPFTGFVLRGIKNDELDKISLYRNADEAKQSTLYDIYNGTELNFKGIKLARTGNDLYGAVKTLNDTNPSLEKISTYTSVKTFNAPLTFGATLDAKLKPERYMQGTLSNLTLTNKYNIDDLTSPIVLPTPSRTGYIFKGWYSDPGFTNLIGIGGSHYNLTNDITLYAKWITEEEDIVTEYVYNGEMIFNGTNYINTEMYLYNESNFNKNFYISFNIVEFDKNNNIHQNTIMSAMKEVDPWPGHVFKYIVDGNKKVFRIDTNSPTRIKIEVPTTITNFRMLRINHNLYYSVDGGNFILVNDYSNFTRYFDVPLTFGASIDGNGNIWRYFKGTLSDIEARFISDDATVSDYEQSNSNNNSNNMMNSFSANNTLLEKNTLNNIENTISNNENVINNTVSNTLTNNTPNTLTNTVNNTATNTTNTVNTNTTTNMSTNTNTSTNTSEVSNTNEVENTVGE